MGSREPYRRCHGRRGTSFRFPFAFLLLISLVFSSAAQPPSSGSSGAYPSSYGRFNPSMAIIIIVLISAFFFMGFFSIYLRQCGDRADPSIRPAGFGVRSRRAAARGLDPEVIQTFPALNYSDIKEHKIGKGALECAVCLSEFDDDDTLRLLPKCDHVFHPDCIDAWLSAHTTCPVCRANLVPQPGEPVPAPIPVVSAAAAAAETDSAAAPGDDGAGGGELQRESDNSSSPVRQQPDHVSIIVDDLTAPEPRKEESSTAPSAAEKVTRFSTKGLIPWRSKSSIRPPRFPRSHSTGHSLTVVQPGEDCERYTLRLPDHIRRDIMTGKLQRSSSCAAFPNAGEGSSTRKGVYGGGEGSSRGGAGGSIGGRSFKLRKWEWVAKSDRWAFFTRTFSMRTPRGDAAAEGSTTRRGVTGGEGSVRRGADGGDEGSVKAKAFPSGCHGGGEDVTAASPKAAGSTTSRV